MSSQSGQEKSAQDDGFAQMIMIFVATIVVCLLIPVALMGYILYSAGASRGGVGRRVARVGLILGIYGTLVYYLFGAHPEFAHYVNSASPFGEKLATPVWQGALRSDFMSFTSGVVSWIIHTLPRGVTRNSPKLVFEGITHMAYWPLMFGPPAAIVWMWKKPGSALYEFSRKAALYSYFPMIWGANHFAMKGERVTALFATMGQTLGALFFSWLFSTVSPALAFIFPLGVFYAGSGFLIAVYELNVGELAGLRYTEASSSDLITFGVDKQTRQPVSLTLSQLRHHVHVVGASGFGKSVFLMHLIRHHVAHRLGLIFVDLKADFDTVSEITALAKKAGRISDLKILDLSNPKISMAYNPCRRGNATEIKDKIVGAFEWESEYYKNASQSFLLTVLRALCFLRDEMHKSFTLEDIYQATVSPDSLIALEMELNRSPGLGSLTDDINDLAGWLRLRENFKELQGLRTQLKMLLDSEFGAALKSDRKGIDFYSAIQDQEIVYVLLDSQTYGETAKKLGRLILQDMKSCSGTIATQTTKEDRRHCTFIVDEFADLATDQFVGFINRARGSRLGIVIAHQDVSDLSAFSESMRDQVMTCTSTTVSFLQKVPESAERISGLAGTKTVTKRTRQVGEENFLLFKMKTYTGVESERETEEYNVHPNVLKSLTPGHCVIIGKYPSSWHAEVAVARPPQGHDAGAAKSGSTLVTLSELKARIEREASGFMPLNLKERASRFRESDRKKGRDLGDEQGREAAGLEAAAGLRSKSPATSTSELVPAHFGDKNKKLKPGHGAELDDRF